MASWQGYAAGVQAEGTLEELAWEGHSAASGAAYAY